MVFIPHSKNYCSSRRGRRSDEATPTEATFGRTRGTASDQKYVGFGTHLGMQMEEGQWGELVSMTPGVPSQPLFKEESVFGRSNTEMKIHVQVISARHFHIYRVQTNAGINYILRDTSTNGTFVNGEPVDLQSHQCVIKIYDQISMLDPRRTNEAVQFMFLPYNEAQEEEQDGGPQGDFVFGELCGTGSFAVVRKVTHKENGQVFAMKIVNLQKCHEVQTRPSQLDDEINILKDLHHENIVRLYNTFTTKRFKYIQLELVEGGEMFDHIVAERSFSEEKCRVIMAQLFSALEYLHSHNIIHRDLKPENILCTKGKNGILIKISDFGLSRTLHEQSLARTMCGTPLYVAPEILTSRPYNGSKVDVWSAGVLLYVMACGFPPFDDDGHSTRQLFDNILAGNYTFRSPYWDTKSSELKDLIRHMMTVSVDERFSIEECMAHPFMKHPAQDAADFYDDAQFARSNTMF